MAFIDQVQDLTSLTVSDTGELDQFLTDGAVDIINKIISIRPDMMELFSKESSASSSAGVDVNNAPVLSAALVYAGSSSWASYQTSSFGNDVSLSVQEFPCERISRNMAYKSKDNASIHYRSIFNGGYYVHNGKVFSAPDGGTDWDLKVIHIHYPTVVNTETSASASLAYFCSSCVYMIPLYAATKLLHATLSAISMPSVPVSNVDFDFVINDNLGLDDPGTLSLSISLPVAPALSSSSVSFSQTAPTFTKPVLSLEAAPTISTFTISATPPVAPALTDNSIDSSSLTAPVYTSPVISAPDWSSTDSFITDEDPEMSAARVQEIQAKISEYNANIQDSVNVFTKNQASFQADLKVLSDNAQLASSDDAKKIQKYQAENQTYTAEVSKEVQEYQQNFQKDLQLWQAGRQTDLQKYSADIQNEISKFNEENAEYQAQLQISIQDAQLNSSDDAQLLQKYQTDISNYQAELGQEVQEYQQNLAKYNAQLSAAVQIWSKRQSDLLQKYSTQIQDYSAQVATKNSEYQWLVDQYTRLKNEYTQAFIALNPRATTREGSEEKR